MLEKPVSALMLTLLAIAMVMACGGCGPTASIYYEYKAKSYLLPSYDLKNASYEDRDIIFSIKAMPDEAMASRSYPFHSDARIRYFALTVQNKTNKDMTIDWSRVYFLNKDGQLDGGFMLEGEYYEDRYAFKQPLLVLANSTCTTKIYPNNLVVHVRGWENQPMENNTFGVYAIVDVKGQEKRIRVTVDIGPSR